jgi:hypothetical protein
LGREGRLPCNNRQQIRDVIALASRRGVTGRSRLSGRLAVREQISRPLGRRK